MKFAIYQNNYCYQYTLQSHTHIASPTADSKLHILHTIASKSAVRSILNTSCGYTLHKEYTYSARQSEISCTKVATGHAAQHLIKYTLTLFTSFRELPNSVNRIFTRSKLSPNAASSSAVSPFCAKGRKQVNNSALANT